MITLNDLEWELADILTETIIHKRGKPTYKELAEELSKRLGRNVNPHYGLSVPLGNVSILSFELDLPLISAWVLYSGDSSAKRISDGFYNFACDYRPEYKSMEPVAAWKSELRKIEGCKQWQILRYYLDNKLSINDMQTPSPLNEDDAEAQKNALLVEEKLLLHKYYQESAASDPTFPDEIEYTDVMLPEGKTKQILVNIRERNSKARRINIGRYGTRCAVCEVDLGEVYGAEFSGKIHVHHLNPIGETRGEHEVNPLEDLRPVCPNCHMIIHCKQNPPYTIEEVKQMLADNKKD